MPISTRLSASPPSESSWAYCRMGSSILYRCALYLDVSDTTKDLSTSLPSRSSTSASSIPSPAPTASTASSGQPPANADSRANSARSDSLSSLQLQSSVPRRVCCLDPAVRRPVLMLPKGLVASRRFASPTIYPPAVASSMASGIPSSFWQASATASVFSGVRSKPGQCRRTRSRNAAPRRSASSPLWADDQCRAPRG